MDCLNILITSRDEPDIRECFNPTPDREIFLNNSAADKEIKTFVIETLRKNKKLHLWFESFSEIEQALVEGAQGIFRWVDCQLQTLRRYPNRFDHFNDCA